VTMRIMFLALFLNGFLAQAVPAPAQQAGASEQNLLQDASHALASGRFSEAAEILERLLAGAPASGEEAYMMLAEAYLKLGKPDTAVEACERGFSHSAQAERLEQFYVYILKASRTPTIVIDKLEKQLERSPGSLTLRKALGYMLFRQDPMDPKAEQLLRDAAQTAPKDAEARFLYGQWACLNNQDSVCIKELEASLSLTPDNDSAAMQAQTLIAMAYRNQQDSVRAEAAFRNALKHNRRLSPPSTSAGYQYAKFLIESGRDREAAALVEELLRWNPDFGPARYEKARALSRAGDLEGAAREGALALRTLERDDPTLLVAAHAFMAKTCFALGRVEEAKAHQTWLQKKETESKR
jgi:tetratricopeptide (TPR) repeat protein